MPILVFLKLSRIYLTRKKIVIGVFQMASKYKMVAIFIYFSWSYKMKDAVILWLFNIVPFLIKNRVY